MPLMERFSAATVGLSSGIPELTDFDPDAVKPRMSRDGGDGSGTADAWAAVGGDQELLGRVSVTEGPGLPASRLGVQELARATVAACALAAAELTCVRAPAGSPASRQVPAVRVDDGAVATAFTSERHLMIDGRTPASFAPLSRFWPTADGWLRTHANYPHHRARLLTALGVTDTGDDAAVSAALGDALRERRAAEVEETVFAADGLAVAVRDAATWAQHPQGALVAGRPLIGIERLDQAAPLPLPERDGGGTPAGVLDGVRVLDLTRVIAGPVASRVLAQLGADVLRLDPPHLPENPDAHADTGFGKRSAFLDLSGRSGQATFETLLDSAHVVLTGYRPGALDRFGLAPESLTDRRPGLVVGQLSAWGSYGTWRRRRGFDSLVQAAGGIAVREEHPDGTPGSLPAQALDHGTGYLLAAAVLRSLTEARRGRSGSRVVRAALTQTADWLLNGLAPAVNPETGHEPAPWTTWTDSPLGRLRHALPAVMYDGAPTAWARPPGVPGTDPCAWW